MSIASCRGEQRVLTPNETQPRSSLRTISIIPLYASVCIESALQSRTRLFHLRHPVSYQHFPCFGAALASSFPSAANPTFSAEELRYQLEATKAKLLFVHPSALQTGLAAARAIGLPNDRIVLIESPSDEKQHLVTLDEVISEGLQHPKPFVDRRFKSGEAKTKVAVSFSPLTIYSGTKVINESSVVLQLILRNDGNT